MIKRDRLAFMQDWNEMRKKNEEFIIKQSAEKEEKPFNKDDNVNPGGVGSLNGLPEENIQEFGDTNKIERDATINLSNQKREKERVQNDSESDVSRNEGIDMEIIWNLKKELNTKIETIEQKINNLNI